MPLSNSVASTARVDQELVHDSREHNFSHDFNNRELYSKTDMLIRAAHDMVSIPTSSQREHKLSTKDMAEINEEVMQPSIQPFNFNL